MPRKVRSRTGEASDRELSAPTVGTGFWRARRTDEPCAAHRDGGQTCASKRRNPAGAAPATARFEGLVVWVEPAAGSLQRELQPTFRFQQFALDYLGHGVPCFAFGKGVAELTTELQQLLVVSSPDPRRTVVIVIRRGDSQKIFQQFAGILSEKQPGQRFALGGAAGVGGELADGGI